jgi:hypothetical protein
MLLELFNLTTALYITSFLINITLVSSYSIYECSGNWNITYSDNRQAGKVFLNWLKAFQNDANRCKANKISRGTSAFSGIGSSYNLATVDFLKQLELGNIYEPSRWWLWANRDNNCTFGKPSFGCFSKPYTYCGHEKLGYDDENWSNFNLEAANNFSTIPLDICQMAITSKKPYVWITGQLLHFLLNPRHDVREIVSKRMSLVYPINNKHITIGVHIRGGQPDGQRKALKVTDVLKKVDEKVEELKLTGKIVTQVFMCSDTQETNIISKEYMTKMYPRNFSYVILPHLNYSVGTEAEYILRDQTTGNKNNNISILIPTDFDIYAEWFTDVEILTHADVFIGSHSNIYITVAALRIARFPERPMRDTGYFDTRYDPPVWMEEGGNPIHGTPIWKNAYGGFRGGVAFWT